MFDTEKFLLICGIHFLAVMSPGPDLIVVTQSGLRAGFFAGLSTAIGVTLGNAVHILVSVFAAGFVASSGSIFLLILKVSGGLYLGFLGFACIKAPRMATENELDIRRKDQEIRSLSIAFLTGFISCALNAKASLYFISLGSQIVSSSISIAENSGLFIAILAITFIWFSGVAALASQTGFRVFLTSKQYFINRAMGALLLCYSGTVLFSIGSP